MSQRGARRGAVASFRRLPSISALFPAAAFLSSTATLSVTAVRATTSSASLQSTSSVLPSTTGTALSSVSLASTSVISAASATTAAATKIWRVSGLSASVVPTYQLFASLSSTSTAQSAASNSVRPVSTSQSSSSSSAFALDTVLAAGALSSVSAVSTVAGLVTTSTPSNSMSSIVADFSSGFGPFSNYTGGVSLVGGRARIPATTAYENISTNGIYAFRNAAVSAQIFPTNGAGAGSSIIQFLLLSSASADGTRLIAAVDSVAATLYVGNESGYYDANAVRIAYNSTSMSYLRWREASGTVYLDTSPDAATWTNRSSFADPSYVASNSDLRVQFVAYQDTGSSYAEVDNVNVYPPVAAAANLSSVSTIQASAYQTVSGTSAMSSQSSISSSASNSVRPTSSLAASLTLSTVTANITVTTAAAPVYRSYTQTITQQQTSITATKPSGTVAGDLLLAFYMASAGSDLNTTISGATAPSGWTQVASVSDTQYTMQKVWYADGGVSSMTFGSSSGTDVSLVIVRITSASTTTVSATNYSATGSTQNPIAPSVNAPKSVGLLLCSAGATPFTNASFTAPSGMTLITSTISQAQYSELGLAYKTLSASGATGTQTFTNSTGNGTGWSAVSVVVSQP